MGAEGAELDGTGSELTKRCALVGLYLYACVYRERERATISTIAQSAIALPIGHNGCCASTIAQSTVAQWPRLHVIEYRFAQPTVAQSTIALAPVALFAS